MVASLKTDGKITKEARLSNMRVLQEMNENMQKLMEIK